MCLVLSWLPLRDTSRDEHIRLLHSWLRKTSCFSFFLPVMQGHISMDHWMSWMMYLYSHTTHLCWFIWMCIWRVCAFCTNHTIRGSWSTQMVLHTNVLRLKLTFSFIVICGLSQPVHIAIVLIIAYYKTNKRYMGRVYPVMAFPVCITILWYSWAA